MIDMERATGAARELLLALGVDAQADGLRATPERVARAWAEVLAGYDGDPETVLLTSDGSDGFDGTSYDGMIVLAGYPFASTCEHHLLPFMGVADVGYLPGTAGKVVGLSKLGRLVDLYARRLQVQERLTAEIAGTLQARLGAAGVGVRLRATHLCMSCRGVRKAGTMSTETLCGVFREHTVRSEFWHLCQPLEGGPR